MKARLIFADNSSPPIEIASDVTVVGRREDCDICLDHKSISKLHCVIARADGTLHVRDLGSTNGTRVNGQKVRRAALLPNDQLNIASIVFRVWLGPDDVVEEKGKRRKSDAAHPSILDGEACHTDDDSDPVILAGPPVQTNDLPDVYPDSPKAKG